MLAPRMGLLGPALGMMSNIPCNPTYGAGVCGARNVIHRWHALTFQTASESFRMSQVMAEDAYGTYVWNLKGQLHTTCMAGKHNRKYL